MRAVQTGILLPLQDVPFFSVETMNVAIHAELERLNDQPMSKGVVRREVFEAGERARASAASPTIRGSGASG